MSNDKLGYYALLPTQDGKGYIGSLLIVDGAGKPVEFRVTYPVKPSYLQEKLYGDSLVPHIAIELCGKPLYQVLTNKPELLLVDTPRFLSLHQSVSCDLVCIRPRAKGRQSAGQEDLSDLSEGYAPPSLYFPKRYDEERRHRVKAFLAPVSANFDLVEPFQRISAALKALQANDERFQ